MFRRVCVVLLIHTTQRANCLYPTDIVREKHEDEGDFREVFFGRLVRREDMYHPFSVCRSEFIKVRNRERTFVDQNV
jgi:hypothetical protein